MLRTPTGGGGSNNRQPGHSTPMLTPTMSMSGKSSMSDADPGSDSGSGTSGVQDDSCCQIRRRIHNLIPYIRNHIVNRQKLDHDLDDLEMQVVRYKPEGLDALCRNTKFSRKELQIMYRGFKQECPTGIVNEETFKDIYAQFFPQGDSSAYAHYVFNTFDQDHNGTISFEEFVVGLSVLARGSLHEKLQWAFSLYDINGDGIITREEMVDIVSAIYDMMGKFSEPIIDEHTARDHVDKVFQQMDANKDGVISVEEFMDTCQRDKDITENIMMFDTVMSSGGTRESASRLECLTPCYDDRRSSGGSVNLLLSHKSPVPVVKLLGGGGDHRPVYHPHQPAHHLLGGGGQHDKILEIDEAAAAVE